MKSTTALQTSLSSQVVRFRCHNLFSLQCLASHAVYVACTVICHSTCSQSMGKHLVDLFRPPTPFFFFFFLQNSHESFSGKQAALSFMTSDPLLLAEPRPQRKESLFSGYQDTEPGRRQSAISCCSTPLPSPSCPAKYHLVFDFSPTMAFSRRTAALRSAGLACRPVLFPLFK